MKEICKELYEQLKGTYTYKGQLQIEGFEYEDYETLYEVLLEQLAPFFKGDYYDWYDTVATQYKRYRKATNRRYDVKCPQSDLAVEEQTVREQLALMKFFLYRRAGRGKTPYDT